MPNALLHPGGGVAAALGAALAPALLVLAVLAAGVVYGTDAFFALVGRAALARSRDVALVDVVGHLHAVADWRMPAVGATALASTLAYALAAGLSTASGRLALAALAGAPALAGGQASRPRDASPCPGSQTQLELNLCASAAAARADSALQRTYAAQLARVDSARRPAFAEVQAAWGQYRSASCRYRASAYEGGSMQPMAFGRCMAAEAAARERQLRRDPAGDLARTSVPMCRGDQVALRTDDEGDAFAGMSQNGTYLVLRNTSRSACRAPAFPTLALADTSGEVPATATARNARVMRPGPVVLPIVVAPGQAVRSRLHWVVGPVFEENVCRTPTRLAVVIEGVTQTIPFSGGQMCGDRTKGGITYEITRFVLDPTPDATRDSPRRP